MVSPRPAATTVRLAEVVGSLSLVADLALGQPLEQGLRRALLAVWLGEDLGLSADELNTVYFVAQLGTVGCILEMTVLAAFVQDEIAVAEQFPYVDPGRTVEVAALFLRNAWSRRAAPAASQQSHRRGSERPRPAPDDLPRRCHARRRL